MFPKNVMFPIFLQNPHIFPQTFCRLSAIFFKASDAKSPPDLCHYTLFWVFCRESVCAGQKFFLSAKKKGSQSTPARACVVHHLSPVHLRLTKFRPFHSLRSFVAFLEKMRRDIPSFERTTQTLLQCLF